MEALTDAAGWVAYYYSGVFLHGFCLSLVRPAVLGFLAAVIFFQVGRGLGGLPDLFLRPRWWSRGLVGVAVGAVVWQVMLDGYIFEELATNYSADRRPFCEIPEPYSAVTEVVAVPGYPMRFRLAPAAITSVLKYALLVAGCGAVTAGVVYWLRRWGVFAVVALAAAHAFGDGVGGRLAGWVGGEPQRAAAAAGCGVAAVLLALGSVSWLRAGRRSAAGRPPQPTILARLGIYLPLVAGMAIGFALAAGVTYVLSPDEFAGKEPTPVPFTPGPAQAASPAEAGPAGVTGFGQALYSWGEWGKTASRQDKLKELNRQLVGPPPPAGSGAVTRREELKEWHQPYYPLYGAYVVVSVVIFAACVLFAALPYVSDRLFSPVVAILGLLSLLVVGRTVLNLFTPMSVDFALVGLATWAVVASRRYKVTFPGLPPEWTRAGPSPDPSPDLPPDELHLAPPLSLAGRYQTLCAIDARRNGEYLANRREAEDSAALDARDRATDERVLADVYETAADPTRRPLLTRDIPHFPQRLVRKGDGPNSPLVIVCVSGGGSRAASWTLRTLLEIERAFARADRLQLARQLQAGEKGRGLPVPHPADDRGVGRHDRRRLLRRRAGGAGTERHGAASTADRHRPYPDPDDRRH